MASMLASADVSRRAGPSGAQAYYGESIGSIRARPFMIAYEHTSIGSIRARRAPFMMAFTPLALFLTNQWALPGNH